MLLYLIELYSNKGMGPGTSGVHRGCSDGSVTGSFVHLCFDGLVAAHHRLSETLHVERPDRRVLSHLEWSRDRGSHMIQYPNLRDFACAATKLCLLQLDDQAKAADLPSFV